MRKLRSLSVLVLLVAAVGYAARRFLGGRQDEWQTLGAVPSPAAPARTAPNPVSPAGTDTDTTVSPDPFWDLPDDSPKQGLGPEPVDLSEPADLYDVEPGDTESLDATESVDASGPAEAPGQHIAPPKPFDPLTDPLPDEDLE